MKTYCVIISVIWLILAATIKFFDGDWHYAMACAVLFAIYSVGESE